MPETSGSAAFGFDWGTGEIVHRDGRRWRPTRRAQGVYAALDACRGEALSSERLVEAIWGNEVIGAENVRMQVRALRRLCGREVVETTPLGRPAHGGPPRCGYRVR